jgi:hypothetical protein
MNEQLSKYHYNLLLGNENENRTLEEYKLVNIFLKSNDWLFISPLFFQGYELASFLKLSKKENPDKKEILKIIISKFYNLKHVASFIEGDCSRCENIKPFLASIENSLILCFQKDYEGSIKTIIPIVEGILRKYLKNERGYTNDRIQFKDLKRSFEYLKDDLLENYIDLLRNYKVNNQESIEFTEEQFNNLVANHNYYHDAWFSFATEFINESFYLKTTNGQVISNEVNRHSILHELGFEFEYNFENYIKIFFLLQFLTWVFLKKEKQSLFHDEMKPYRYFEKIRAYEKIIEYSDQLIFEKHTLLKNYPSYNDSILKEKFPLFKNDMLSKKELILNNVFRKIEKFIWKRKI